MIKMIHSMLTDTPFPLEAVFSGRNAAETFRPDAQRGFVVVTPGKDFDMLNFCTFCPECGATVPTIELHAGNHECAFETFLEHQTSRARRELRRLETAVAEWERDPLLEKRVAFSRWLREGSLRLALPD
jgi:hypothetical protein